MKATLNGKNDHRYLLIASAIERQIMDEVLKIGDKLPSVRMLSKNEEVSVSTVLQAYYHLEGKGLIESRPQSGYYVRFSPARFPQKGRKEPPLANGKKQKCRGHHQ